MTDEAFTRLVQWWTRNWTGWQRSALTNAFNPKIFDDFHRMAERARKFAHGISLALSNDYIRSVEYPFPVDTGPVNCSHGVPLSDDCVECMKQHLEEVIR